MAVNKAENLEISVTINGHQFRWPKETITYDEVLTTMGRHFTERPTVTWSEIGSCLGGSMVPGSVGKLRQGRSYSINCVDAINA